MANPNNVKLVAIASLEFAEDGTTPIYRVTYRMTQPVNGVINGGVDVEVNGFTESEISNMIQERCAAKANADIGEDVFTAGDVIGGRV